MGYSAAVHAPLLSVLVGLTGAPPDVIALYPRTATVLVDAADDLGEVDRRRVCTIGSRALAEKTSLELVLPSAVGLDRASLLGCPAQTRLACWANAARAVDAEVSFLFVVALRTEKGDGLQVDGIWLDVQRAAAAPSNLEGAMKENWIFENAAVVLAAEPVRYVDSALKRFFERVFLETLEASIRRNDSWLPYSAIQIVGAPPGLQIVLDAKTIGTTNEADITIFGVRRGEHVLTIGQDHAVAFNGTVTAGNNPATVTIERRRPPGPSVANRLITYGAFAASVVGAGVILYAAAAAPGDAAGLCTGSGCGTSSGGWVTSCQLGGNDESCVRDPVGLLVPGFGLALMSGGAATGLGGLLAEDDDGIPWWSLAIGAAIGIAVYGATALLFYPSGAAP